MHPEGSSGDARTLEASRPGYQYAQRAARGSPTRPWATTLTCLTHRSRRGEGTLSAGVAAARAPRRRGTDRQERIEETANSWQRDVQGQRAPHLEEGRSWRFDRVWSPGLHVSRPFWARAGLLGPGRATHQPGTATAKPRARAAPISCRARGRMDSMCRKVMDRMYVPRGKRASRWAIRRKSACPPAPQSRPAKVIMPGKY